MKITIITLFPKMLSGFFDESIVKRAIEKKLVEIEIINLRDFAIDSYGTVDDRPYGGGAGMVLRVEPIYKAINSVIDKKRQRIILTSPKGKLFNQKKAIEFSKLQQLIIIAGHYEGVDERVRDLVDEEISLGDFVMTGGEITAAAITDSVVRLIPGVLKKNEATQLESFFDVSINRPARRSSAKRNEVGLIEVIGETPLLKKMKKKGIKKIKLLEYPHYTRPEEFMGKKVPTVLLSGNHRDIENWRIERTYKETLKRRPDLLK
jgi:tRNA (guanine37-N1)-methyltransferase